MDSQNDPDIDLFAAMVRDAKSAGVRVLSKWIGNPPAALLKTDPHVYELLKNLKETDAERVMPLIDFALQTSFFYLFKHLEEGDGEMSFSM